MIRILVINIDSARERWNNISAQLNGRQNIVERFQAVDGKRCEHPLFVNYDHILRQRRKGKGLSRGQLGCFASHHLAWEKCIKINSPVIILEDDVTIIEPEFSAFLEIATSLNPRFECIRLFENKAKSHSKVLVEDFGELQIVKYTKGPMSTMGYYLTPSGAEKFIKSSKPWFLPVDMYMDRFWQNGVECFGLMNPVVKHEYLFESMIGYDPDRPKRSIALTIKRELFSVNEITRRFFHNLRFRLGLLCSRHLR